MATAKPTRPTRIKIGPHNYTIHWSEKEWDENASDGADASKSAQGLTQAWCNKLFVNGWELSSSQQKEVLVHEILHACFDLSCYAHSDFSILEDVEEYTIRNLSPWLFTVLRENPKVMAWIMHND